MKEMFLRLDKEGVISGAEKDFKEVVRALKEGGPTGRGKRIEAVLNKDRKLDKRGMGYSEDTNTNVTWKNIPPYIKCNVFDSDFFVPGNILFRQKKGGIISA